MKLKDPVGWAAAIGAGILATVALIPQARGELVYEEQPGAQAGAPTQAQVVDPRTDDRQNLRQVIAASQKAQNTLAAEAPAPAPVAVVRPVIQAQPVVQAQPVAQIQAAPVPVATVQVAPAQPAYYAAPAPVLAPAPTAFLAQQATVPAVTAGLTSDAAPGVTAPAAPEVQNLSRAELMRRERVREELRNEDVLQERLEQLRLRDEKRRTDELIAGKPLDDTAAQPATAAAAGPALQNQLVVAPPSEQPGQPGAPVAVAPLPTAAVASAYPPGTAYPGAVPNPNPGQPIYTDQVTSTAAMTTSVSNSPETSEKTTLLITGHAGLSNVDVNSAFNVDPHFSTGVGLGVSATDSITFEVGYSYNQYGIGLASSSPFVAGYQNFMAATGQTSTDTLNMNQNVFEAGLKLSLLGPDSKIRPFVGGGGAYAKSYINYSQQVQQALGPYLGNGYGGASQDYELSQYLGYLTTGIDVRLTKSVTIGASFKYYTVLSSNENQPLAYGGFLPTYGYGYGGIVNSDKSVAGASLSESSFYTISGDVSFVF